MIFAKNFSGKASLDKPKVYTLDIFDTCLTRRIGNPQDLFFFLGKRLFEKGFINCSPELFARSRKEAENRAVNAFGESCAGIEEIYQRLGEILKVKSPDLKILLEEELNLENEFIVKVPAFEKYLAEIQGNIKLFISDTYFPARFLAAQLKKTGFFKDEDPIFASCEFRASKKSGELFKAMLHRTGYRASEIKHIGNDRQSDFEGAAKAGIRAEIFSEANLSRYEKKHSESVYLTEGLGSLFAGASRYVRLSLPAGNIKERAIREVCSGVAAPLLTAYVQWILAQALEQGIKRLYFISRDGQVLLEIAKRIILKNSIDIELRYLYGGRHAWYLPGVQSSSRLGEDEIMKAPDFLSPESLFSRLNLTCDEVESELAELGLKKKDWDKNLSEGNRALIISKISNGFLDKKISSKAESSRRLLFDYLSQEKVGDGVRSGFVDLGWRGNLQRSVSGCLKDNGRPLPVWFYFGLARKNFSRDEGKSFCYMFDVEAKTGSLKLWKEYISWMEIFTAGDHGSVLGYHRTGSGIDPVLSQQKNDDALAWGLDYYRRAVRAFVEALDIEKTMKLYEIDVRTSLDNAFSAFHYSPTREEAQAWGSFVFSTDPSGKYGKSFAYPFRFNDWAKMLMGKYYTAGQRWKMGSWVLTPRMTRFTISLTLFIKKKLGKLIRKLKN